jgi:hypothetical protein
MSTESIEPKPERRLKRGDVREDGKVFWAYGKSYEDNEYWVTEDQFLVLRSKSSAADRKRTRPTKLGDAPFVRLYRLGHVREDGKIFWCYRPDGKQQWLTPEQFERRRKQRNQSGQRNSKRRRAEDPMFNLQCRVRDHSKRAARLARANKPGSSFDVLGTSLEEFKRHIEEKFVDGMSWDRMSEIHIDHIIPLSSAKTPEEVWKLAHYTNLQPLWAVDNLRKSAKMPDAR